MENSQDPDPELFGQKGTMDMLLTLTKRAHAFVSVLRRDYFYLLFLFNYIVEFWIRYYSELPIPTNIIF